MCKKVKGIGAGKKALRASSIKTEESLPIEYINTGFLNAPAVSRSMLIASASKASNTWSVLIRT
jgi:hypothetical protein